MTAYSYAGFVKVRVGVFNPYSSGRVLEVNSLVDTGAIYTIVNRSILKELSIKPLERRRFKAFGGYVEKDVGEAGLLLEQWENGHRNLR